MGRRSGRIDESDVLAERIGAERIVIPGAFHSPNRAQPAAFNARLAEFLDSASSNRRGGAAPTDPTR